MRRRLRVPEGAIKFRLKEMMLARGLVHQAGPHKGKPHVKALENLTHIDYSTLTELLLRGNGIQAISWGTLGRLCKALNCQPGDLIVYVGPEHLPAATLEQYYRLHPEGEPTEHAEYAIAQW